MGLDQKRFIQNIRPRKKTEVLARACQESGLDRADGNIVDCSAPNDEESARITPELLVDGIVVLARATHQSLKRGTREHFSGE